METAAHLTRRSSLLRWMTVGALAYGSFTLGLLLLAPLIPILFLGELVARRAALWGRGFTVALLRFYLFKILPVLGVYRFEEWPECKEIADLGSVVLVANHRSWFDAMFLLCLFPTARVPVKMTYLRLPVLGALSRRIGGIPLDSTSPASSHACASEAAASLASGDSLLLCPEGTRAKIGPMRPFTNVFFRVAIDAGTPIVPVVVHSDVPCMGPGSDGKTVMLPWRPAVWRLRGLEPIMPDQRDRAVDLSRQAQKKISKVLLELDDQVAQGETQRKAAHHG